MAKVVGHEKEQRFLEKLLKPGVEGRTLHFTGPSRLGKKFVALQCALKLRGELHGELYGDGEKALQHVLQGDHPDITLFSPEGKVAFHSADATRGVIDSARQPPYQGAYRVLIVDGAERMQGVSSHTLLKTLEEPLPSTFIFLISERKEQMLPTILSRAIEVTFSPLSKETIFPQLKGEGKISPELAVTLSRGSLSRAKDYFLEGLPSWRAPLLRLLSTVDPQTYFMFREEIKKLVEPIVALKEETPLRYFEVVHELFEAILGWFRDLHLLYERADRSLLTYPDQLSLLELRLERGNIPPLDRVLKAAVEAHLGVDRSNSLQTTLESFLLSTLLIRA